MKFDKYTPQTLRKAIEIEMQKNSDVKIAVTIAIKNLKKDPNYYDKHEVYI